MENETKMHQPSPVEEQEEIKSSGSPQEIIVDILSRLPVKSVCRFRCVSKQWLSFITNPGLAKSHLRRTVTNDRLHKARTRVVLFQYRKAYYLEYRSIGILGGYLNLMAIEFDHPLNYPNIQIDHSPFPFPILFEVVIVGSRNGLVFISSKRNILYLYNPSTKESKRIPDSPFGYRGQNWDHHGFGFDYVNDDYKIVKVGYTGFVYSLKTDSWKVVSCLPLGGRVNGPGVFLNGSFHWMCSRIDEDDFRCVIARFSFEDEVFVYMPAPDDLEWSLDFVVGILNSRLCVFHNDYDWHNDIWMMTEYGMAESWTRIRLGFFYASMKHVCVAQNGYDLLRVDGQLLMYSFEDRGSFKFLDVDGIDGPVEAGVYVESLVSPNAAIEF